MDACTVPLISILTQRRRILSCCRVFLFKLLLTLSASNNNNNNNNSNIANTFYLVPSIRGESLCDFVTVFFFRIALALPIDLIFVGDGLWFQVL